MGLGHPQCTPTHRNTRPARTPRQSECPPTWLPQASATAVTRGSPWSPGGDGGASGATAPTATTGDTGGGQGRTEDQSRRPLRTTQGLGRSRGRGPLLRLFPPTPPPAEAWAQPPTPTALPCPPRRRIPATPTRRSSRHRRPLPATQRVLRALPQVATPGCLGSSTPPTCMATPTDPAGRGLATHPGTLTMAEHPSPGPGTARLAARLLAWRRCAS